MPDGGPHEASPNDWMSRPYAFIPADYEELLARVEALEALGKVTFAGKSPESDHWGYRAAQVDV